jgi:hypothetical protein
MIFDATGALAYSVTPTKLQALIFNGRACKEAAFAMSYV